jgi:hypothetical protein
MIAELQISATHLQLVAPAATRNLIARAKTFCAYVDFMVLHYTPERSTESTIHADVIVRVDVFRLQNVSQLICGHYVSAICACAVTSMLCFDMYFVSTFPGAFYLSIRLRQPAHATGLLEEDV